MRAQPARPRWPVHVFLVGFLAVLAVDAFHPVNGAHRALKETLNTPLLWTGLWQGPWRLYAPNVPKDNLRLRAEMVFADQAIATWTSPTWSQHGFVQRFLEVRHVNYFNAVILAGREPAWDALCAYLARTTAHPQGKPAAVVAVKLYLRGAIVPPPRERLVPAEPYLAYDDWSLIRTWGAAP